jgi:hypothetical protein
MASHKAVDQQILEGLRNCTVDTSHLLGHAVNYRVDRTRKLLSHNELKASSPY